MRWSRSQPVVVDVFDEETFLAGAAVGAGPHGPALPAEERSADADHVLGSAYAMPAPRHRRRLLLLVAGLAAASAFGALELVGRHVEAGPPGSPVLDPATPTMPSRAASRPPAPAFAGRADTPMGSLSRSVVTVTTRPPVVALRRRRCGGSLCRTRAWSMGAPRVAAEEALAPAFVITVASPSIGPAPHAPEFGFEQ